MPPIEKMNQFLNIPAMMDDIKKPRARFCWHCARKFQGSHFAEHETGSGTVYVHKDCKKILDGGFDHVRAVDDEGGEDLQSEFIR
jgi:hypothetical protein